jgi:L-lactate dehydrogenase complex protein LldE
MTAAAPTVALLVTCLVDAVRPAVAEAAVRLLEGAGFRVVVPGQACCGQANFNGGDRAGAARLAARTIAAFRGFERVVAPSGSCVAMIREYPGLFAQGSAERAAAEDLVRRCFELTQFLRGVAGPPAPPMRWAASAAYHDACSGLRALGIRSEPRSLLAQVRGLELRELAAPEECCGFGGLFCVKYPEVSARIGDHKIDDIAATGAGHVIGGDLGCLLHLEGRMQRRGLDIRAVHVAEVLAGMVPGAAAGND